MQTYCRTNDLLPLWNFNSLQMLTDGIAVWMDNQMDMGHVNYAFTHRFAETTACEILRSRRAHNAYIICEISCRELLDLPGAVHLAR